MWQYAFAAPMIHAYEPDNIQDALDRGKTVVVMYQDFYCAPCKVQERIVMETVEQNPDFDKLTIISVDFEEYRDLPVAMDRDVEQSSTMLVLNSGGEIARIIEVTSEEEIKDFMNIGLGQ